MIPFIGDGSWLHRHIKSNQLYLYNLRKRRLFKLADNVHFMGEVFSAGEKNISIGAHTHIGAHSIITAWDKTLDGTTHQPSIIIGSYANIGEYNHITATNKIQIGHNFLTGRWVTITDNSHGKTDYGSLQIPPLYRTVVSKGAVIIGDNVWIGDKATILPGVTIGNGSVIGANSVVSKDIPPYCIACGNPAKVIKSNSPEKDD
ncbi:MAG: acyltransferase [Bacteroidales bacterium]|nr:acyltransferase [Candidatus Cacconaster merdequi]